MAEMEHYDCGISILRNAVEVPDWIFEGLEDEAHKVFDDQYESLDDGTFRCKRTATLHPEAPQGVHRIEVHNKHVVQLDEKADARWRALSDVTYGAVLKYAEKYTHILSMLWWCNRGNINYYNLHDTGGYLMPHADNDCGYAWAKRDEVVGGCEMATRGTVTAIAHLVDEPEGDGSFYFKYADLDVPQRAGDVIVFPANFLGTHEVTPIRPGHQRISYQTYWLQGSALPLMGGGVPIHIEAASRPDAAHSWVMNVTEAFMESSGWTVEQLEAAFPNYWHRGMPDFWWNGEAPEEPLLCDEQRQIAEEHLAEYLADR